MNHNIQLKLEKKFRERENIFIYKYEKYNNIIQIIDFELNF